MDKYRPGHITTNKDGVAVEGYDAVAYFTMNKPTRGSLDFTSEWAGVKWQFSSAKHKKMFDSDPNKYAPQFGGNCSVATSFGQKLKGSPKHWRIEGDRLYLNASVVSDKLFYRPLSKRIHSLAEGSKERSPKD